MKFFENVFCAIIWYKNSLCVQMSCSKVLKRLRIRTRCAQILDIGSASVRCYAIRQFRWKNCNLQI